MGPWILPALLAGGSLLSGAVSGDPYADAEKAASQEFNTARGDMMPFINAGQGTISPLQSATNSLLNPAALRQQWLNSYTESPEAKYEQNMATQQGLNAAAAQGLTGSSTALNSIQEGTGMIGLQDQQNYLSDLMNKYQMGVGNLRSMFGTGANLTGWMGEGGLAENAAGTMGNLAYGRAQAPMSMFNKMLGLGAGYEMGGLPGMEASAGFSGPQINAVNGQPAYSNTGGY